MTALPLDATTDLVAGNDRALDVIDALVTRAGVVGAGGTAAATGAAAWGVRELAEHLQANRSTVNRALQGLTARHIAREVNGSYTIGRRLQVLMKALFRRHRALGPARDALAQLGTECDATAMLAVQGADGEAFAALVHARPGPVRYNLTPGMTLPLHAGAAGRAILMELGMPALDHVRLQQFSSDTVTDRRRLAAEIADAQNHGYVMSVGQHIPLAAGVAAPFRLPSGLVGAVSITRSRYETDDADLNKFAPLAVATAQQITDLSANHHPEPLRPRTRGGVADQPGGALSRIINLIETLVAHPDGLTATNRDLARRLGATPPTTQRLRGSALLAGLTTTRQADELFPGPLLLKWAAILGPHVDLNTVVQPEIDRLSTETGETIGYIRYDPATATATMSAVASNNGNPLTYGLGADVTIPLYAGAAGKAILAHCPQDVIDDQKLEPINPGAVIDPDQLHAELDTIRQHGYATADGERIPDAYGLAAPVFTNGTVSGSVTISIPSYRVAQADLPTLATALTTTTGRLSWLLSTTD